jgi:Flp pilus assembly pilin Flp
MNQLQTSLYLFLRDLIVRQEGQDLVEYCLIFSGIALGVVSGMGYVATGLNMVFSSSGSFISTSVT